MKNRLGIVVMYDEEGIAHEYLLYYLNSLKKVCDRLILVVNGIIQAESLKKCYNIVDDIYVRSNENLDIGAYLDVIHNYLSLDECMKYNEIVLSNDTLFGPFKEFKEIFYDMGKIKCDVWGLNINPLTYLNHIQSYFYCFRNRSIKDALVYWESVELPDLYSKSMYVGAYELGLSNYLLDNGKVIDAYSVRNQFDVFNMPQLLLRYCNFPFLKKSLNSCTLSKDIMEYNYMECIDYIKEISDYPITYITKYLKEKFDIDIIKVRNTLNVIDCEKKSNNFKRFINKFSGIYIYGIGEYGQMLYGMLGKEHILGFIVSANEHINEIYGVKVYCIDDVDRNLPILVAMSKKNTQEVVSNLIGYKNVCYLWEQQVDNIM